MQRIQTDIYATWSAYWGHSRIRPLHVVHSASRSYAKNAARASMRTTYRGRHRAVKSEDFDTPPWAPVGSDEEVMRDLARRGRSHLGRTPLRAGDICAGPAFERRARILRKAVPFCPREGADALTLSQEP